MHRDLPSSGLNWGKIPKFWTSRVALCLLSESSYMGRGDLLDPNKAQTLAGSHSHAHTLLTT